MIHMDVDTHSPPSRRQRYTSVKRARSPELSGPQERPSKRHSLATGHANPYAAPSIRRRIGDSSTGSSRHSSEDWVQQTGGLTIDSPVCAGSFFPEEMCGAEQVQKDEDMMVLSTTYNLQQCGTRVERPHLPFLQTSGYPAFTSGQSPNLDMAHGLHGPPIPCIASNPMETVPLQVSSPPLKHDRQYRRKSLPGPDPVGPSISVIPPTPMEQPATYEYRQISSPLALNPGTGSQVAVMRSPSKLSTPKRQRFTMGPRADCEKCRLGVKGHFVHLE